jgi:hypothetical protein
MLARGVRWARGLLRRREPGKAEETPEPVGAANEALATIGSRGHASEAGPASPPGDGGAAWGPQPVAAADRPGAGRAAERGGPRSLAAPPPPPPPPPGPTLAASLRGAAPVRLLFEDGTEIALPADAATQRRVAYLLRVMLPPPPPPRP